MHFFAFRVTCILINNPSRLQSSRSPIGNCRDCCENDASNMANRLAQRARARAVIEINGTRDRFIRDFLFLFLFSLFFFPLSITRNVAQYRAPYRCNHRSACLARGYPLRNVNLDENVRENQQLQTWRGGADESLRRGVAVAAFPVTLRP